MTEQLAIVPPEPAKLTDRQQAAYDLIRANDGVQADEIGANWHSIRGKHSADDRCRFCLDDGRDVIRSKALKPLVTYRRTSGGNLYIARDPAARQSDAAQLDQLPGTTFEDIFTQPGGDCSNALGDAA